MERTEEVSLALLVVLEALTPEQRVAFVLHDVFAVPFDEIATVLGTTAQAARQLATRARRAVADGRPRHSATPGRAAAPGRGVPRRRAGRRHRRAARRARAGRGRHRRRRWRAARRPSARRRARCRWPGSWPGCSARPERMGGAKAELVMINGVGTATSWRPATRRSGWSWACRWPTAASPASSTSSIRPSSAPAGAGSTPDTGWELICGSGLTWASQVERRTPNGSVPSPSAVTSHRLAAVASSDDLVGVVEADLVLGELVLIEQFDGAAPAAPDVEVQVDHRHLRLARPGRGVVMSQ